MERYILRVADPEDTGRDADPSVGERVTADVRRLFTEICRNIVRAELRLQGDAPQELYAHLSPEDDSALAADARRFLDGTLDYLGGSSKGTWMDDTFPDPVGRKRIASAVLDIAAGLEGGVLVHGYEGSETVFSGVDTIWVTGMANAMTRAVNGGLVGVVRRDKGSPDSWSICNGETSVPLRFVPTVSRYTREDFAEAGVVIATGTLIRDDEDRIVELRAVENCYTFPGAIFLRAISAEGDLGLILPIEAVPGYYPRTGRWFLRCEELGLEASADSWDACSVELHRMFVELWHSHLDGTAEPNPRLRLVLHGMCPFPS